jgi:Tfp pilus assembly protein PilP
MSRLNLVPWRERQRQTVMRRWQIGGLLAAATTVTVVSAIDHGVAHANKSHEAMMAALQQQQQTLQQQLQEAPLWQARYRQAQQVQQLWPHWQQQQWQALRAYTQLSSVAVRGALSTPDQSAALLAHEGVLYKLGPGQGLGEHGGEVVQVGRNQVWLRQWFVDSQGLWQQQTNPWPPKESP